MAFLKNITLGLSCVFVTLSITAQNITDLSVMDSDECTALPGREPDKYQINDSVFIHPERIRYDGRCILIDGKDTFIFSGSFHYFRTPQPLWKDRLVKLKEAGFNCVETYIPWNWHERRMPKSIDDYSFINLKQLTDFLDITEELGLYVILRPGPYICAEWSGGGFPQWIMRKKPAKIKFETWLQSTDYEFMKWNEHWYKAVCKVIAPYQIINKEKGKGGVIFFQIENEFNRIKWFPKNEKRKYLAGLAEMAKNNGIEVPLITCWTDEARNVTKGPLNGVLDMVNSYPRWNIDGSFGRLINQQLKTQSGKPLMSGELQGGWMSEVGGKLSWEQDGLIPVQTQNITLYALQRGFCALNFYMAVGGTNFDDWGARQITTTYDFAAAIGEDGSINDRYRRFMGLTAFVKEHGTKIVRADVKKLNYVSSDADVKLLVRETVTGDKYYFVRTEEHTKHHFGTLYVDGLSLDFSLEPFGSMVYYLPSGEKQGKWYPELPEPMAYTYAKADTISLGASTGINDEYPKKWIKLDKGEYLDDKGIYGRHFVYYKCYAKEGSLLEIGRIGNKLINGTDKDEVLVNVNGALISSIEETETSVFFRLPGDSLSRKRVEVVMLYESKGLHHHTKKIVEDYWKTGVDFVKCNGRNVDLYYAYTEKSKGEKLSAGKVDIDKISADNRKKEPLLVWHNYLFEVPKTENVYHLKLNHYGNGFIYLNGHCLGRCWEKGPQTEYYLPECWLNYGGENRLTISLRPSICGASIQNASIMP